MPSYSSTKLCEQPCPSFKAGMHNIRPAGQMWPADASNLAQNFVHFFHENIICICKNLKVFALHHSKKFICPSMRLELCIPVLRGFFCLRFQIVEKVKIWHIVDKTKVGYMLRACLLML